MTSILINKYLSSNKFDKDAYKMYVNYLYSIKDKLPVSAYEFATAKWHYDINDHMCPHDSWIEKILINEIAKGSRGEIRNIDIDIVCIGSYHDGNIVITYKNVASYNIVKKISNNIVNIGHGDWLLDEIMMSDNNKVLHDILLSNESRIQIESDDISYLWKQRQ